MMNRNMIRSDLLILLIVSSISVVDSLNCFKNVTFVPVCSNDSIAGNSVYLSGVTIRDNHVHCSCSLSTGSPTNVTITTNQFPHGCGYEFQFLYMSTGKIYSCIKTNVITIQTGGIVQINLLKHPEGDFQVCLQLHAVSSLTLSCTKSTLPTRYKSETKTSINGPSHSTTPKYGKELNRSTVPTSKKENSMSGIIGGSVGGLVVIIIIIIIVICVIRKRRKDKTDESPEAAETDAHPYQNIPDNRSGEITHPYQNIPDNRSGEITHQPKQNNEVVNQENDPYTSIDNDIIKPSNGNQGMEYLENDLSNKISSDYVVVDDKLKAQLPVVAENAQVNKSNANKTANGKFKTGPRGDKYAVVNKGGKMINNDKQFKIGPSGDQYVVVEKGGNKKKNKGAGKQFKIGPRGDQYAVVNKGGGSTNN